MSASKKKGTGYETEVLRAFLAAGFDGERTAPTLPYDVNIHAKATMAGHQVNALLTRPNHGRTLVTIDLPTFLDLLGSRGYGARIECKRYHAFAHHTIYEAKFFRGH